MKKDSLGNRIKSNYEDRGKIFLTRRTPVIIRLDGKAFHTLTKRVCTEKPFDTMLMSVMNTVALQLLTEIQNAKLVYTQSDEISLLLTDFDRLSTDAWFDYNQQKMVSISAAYASVWFSKYFSDLNPGGHSVMAYFDSRAFNIPVEEVANYFRWRYIDWHRNSIQMLAQSLFTHKELHGKNQGDLHEMCFQKGKNWAVLDNRCKNGYTAYKLKNRDGGSTIKDTEKLNMLGGEFISLVNTIIKPEKEG